MGAVWDCQEVWALSDDRRSYQQALDDDPSVVGAFFLKQAGPDGGE